MEIKDNRENYKDDLRGNQYVCLRLLQIFDKICRENQIIYWLTDGTLLGAVRHKGFIPWDDDIDVCIRREDEKKLIEILKKELPEDVFLQIKNTDVDIEHEIIKLRDRYSSVKNDDGRFYHKGIWIDIFPMDEIFRNIYVDKMMKLLPGRFYYQEKTIKKIIKKIIIFPFKIIMGVKTFEEIRIKMYERMSKNNRKNNAYIYFKGEMWWETYLKSDIFPLKELEFENLKCYVPNNYHNYLKYHFGDYMTLPPFDKQKGHSTEVYLTKPCNHKESLNWSKRIKNEE